MSFRLVTVNPLSLVFFCFLTQPFDLKFLSVFCFFFLGDGNCNDTRGLEIAINQRVDDALTSKLPMFYLVNRPHISLVPTAYPLQINLDHKSLSLNWAQGDNSLEIVDGLNGKITERLELLLSLKKTLKEKNHILSKRRYFIEILKYKAQHFYVLLIEF